MLGWAIEHNVNRGKLKLAQYLRDIVVLRLVVLLVLRRQDDDLSAAVLGEGAHHKEGKDSEQHSVLHFGWCWCLLV